MADPDLAPLLLRQRVAPLQAELEDALTGPPPRLPRAISGVQVLLGALALGLLCAGLAMFGVFVVLNLVFHFSPS